MAHKNYERNAEIVAFHPSPYMVEPIDALLQSLAAPDLTTSNLVMPDLLDRSTDGIPASVDHDMRSALETVDRNAVVLCTCSTLGGRAEDIGDKIGLRVIRIDRPMAEGYIDESERVVRERSEEFDVIVLAQGSMSEESRSIVTTETLIIKIYDALVVNRNFDVQ